MIVHCVTRILGKRKDWSVCQGKPRVSPLGHRSQPVSFLFRFARSDLDVLKLGTGEATDGEMDRVMLELAGFVVNQKSQIATALEVFQERRESSAHRLWILIQRELIYLV